MKFETLLLPEVMKLLSVQKLELPARLSRARIKFLEMCEKHDMGFQQDLNDLKLSYVPEEDGVKQWDTDKEGKVLEGQYSFNKLSPEKLQELDEEYKVLVKDSAFVLEENETNERLIELMVKVLEHMGESSLKDNNEEFVYNILCDIFKVPL